MYGQTGGQRLGFYRHIPSEEQLSVNRLVWILPRDYTPMSSCFLPTSLGSKSKYFIFFLPNDRDFKAQTLIKRPRLISISYNMLGKNLTIDK